MRLTVFTAALLTACVVASPLTAQKGDSVQTAKSASLPAPKEAGTPAWPAPGDIPASSRPSEDRHHRHLGSSPPPKQHTKAGRTAAVEDMKFWNILCQEELSKQLRQTPIVKKAKNIIFFLGDGTGISTFTAARLLKGQRTGNFELEQLAWEKFPFSSIIKTYNTNMQTTDSAASATAYLTGVKANQATIGVDANVEEKDCQAGKDEAFHTRSVLSQFQDQGRSGGVVTTTRVTHASPAGNYAHTAERDWESDVDVLADHLDPKECVDIATQLVTGETGSQIKVIMGGGRRGFLPEEVQDPEDSDETGERLDGVNLVDKWLQNRTGAEFLWSRKELLALDTEATDSLLGLFSRSHMEYKIEVGEEEDDPTLQEMTKAAIEVLQKNNEGYFLFVEGGLIDKGHHANKANRAMEEAIEFEKAVETAATMTSDQDTLIIVTADHSHTMTISGYTARGTDILGTGDESDVDDLPFTTLLYGNGPGYKTQKDGVRPNPVEDEDITDSEYRFASAVPMDSSHHNGEDVVLYARGPHAHLFTGVHENAYLPHAMRYAACVGEGRTFCDGL